MDEASIFLLFGSHLGYPAEEAPKINIYICQILNVTHIHTIYAESLENTYLNKPFCTINKTLRKNLFS